MLLYPAPNMIFIDIEAMGGDPTGKYDSTAAITAAIAQGNNAGAGMVWFPAGQYISSGVTPVNNVELVGAGKNCTTILLKAGSNTDLVSAFTSYINLAASFGTSNAGGVNHFAIRNLTLDGNKANQTAGPSWVIRLYGYAYQLTDVIVRNGYSGGMLVDWNGGDILTGENVECFFSNLETHHNNGVGLEIGGPHDSAFINYDSMGNASHNIHIAPNAGGVIFTNFHGWATTWGVNALCVLVEASGVQFYNAVAEASDVCQVAVLGSDFIWDGYVYINGNGLNPVGIQLGQIAGGTPYPSSVYQAGGVTTAAQVTHCKITSKINNCTGGAINFVNESGWDDIYLVCYQTSGSYVLGTPASTTQYVIVGNGLTADGTLAKSGGMQISRSSKNALLINDTFGDNVFVVDTSANYRLAIQSGFHQVFYTDNGVTESLVIQNDAAGTVYIGAGRNFGTFRAIGPNLGIFGGSIALQQSSSAAVLATGGTITTAAVGLARIAPIGAVTGIILQAGSVGGQVCFVVNESANLVTFAAASSNVSGGSSVSIAGGGKQVFVWNSATNLWY